MNFQVEGLGRVGEIGVSFTLLSAPSEIWFVFAGVMFEWSREWCALGERPPGFESPVTPLLSSQAFPGWESWLHFFLLILMYMFSIYKFIYITLLNIYIYKFTHTHIQKKMSRSMWTIIIFEGRYSGDFYFLFYVLWIFYLLDFFINKKHNFYLKNK